MNEVLPIFSWWDKISSYFMLITTNHSLLIVFYLAAALVATRLPFLKVYFSFCNTLVHEVIRVCLTGGASKIQLGKISSDQLLANANSRFKRTFITYAEYTGASLTAIGLFYLVSKQNYQWVLYLFIGLIVVSMLLWIQQFLGFLWALSFTAMLALPLYYGYNTAVMHVSIFLASLILVQSILNGIQLCLHILKERKHPVKEGFLARFKLIPFMLFGVVLLGQSLFAGYFIMRNILMLSINLS